MSSVQNLSRMGSLAMHTLTEGSPTERLLLGGAAAVIGAYIVIKIYGLACRLFAKAHPPYVSIYKLSGDRKKAIEEEVRRKYQAVAPAPSPASTPVSSIAPPQIQSHPLLKKLEINGVEVTKEKEAQLADALHAFHKLKTSIPKEEEGFLFLTEQYLKSSGSGLSSVVVWGEKQLKFSNMADTNKAFADLAQKLKQVELSLSEVKKSERVIAKAYFDSSSSKDIYSLSELYEIVQLQAPHILCSYEIQSKKQQIEEGKKKLHATRLNIVDKTRLTLSDVLLKGLITDFHQKHPELVAIFGGQIETLHFVVDNICWHALDRSLELIENNLIPSKEKQVAVRLADYQLQLAKIMKDETKRAQAQAYLVQILTNPSESAMESLVKLLLIEADSTERSALIKKVQAPELTSAEEAATQELGRLEAVQSFYHVAELLSGALEKGKEAFLPKNGGTTPSGPTLERILSETQPLTSPVKAGQTYAVQIDKVCKTVVNAGETAVQTVAGCRWDQAIETLNQELVKIPKLTTDVCTQLVEQGWTDFKDREALFPITGKHRWLITKAMIANKLTQGPLGKEGKKLLHEVGKRANSFTKTVYGRFVSAFLAFDQRTRWAKPGEFKLADSIATTLIDSISECHQALTRVKKDAATVPGRREDAIVRAVTKGLHPQASNKSSADTVFVGKLIYQFLSILQPKGLQDDFQKILTTSMTKPEMEESSFISNLFETYNQKISPVLGPWVKPVGDFLFRALENIIEKQSTNNVVSQLSDVINPIILNAALVNLLTPDPNKSSDRSEKNIVADEEENDGFVLTPDSSESSDLCEIADEEKNDGFNRVPGQWGNKEQIQELLLERSECEVEIKALETQLEVQKTAGADLGNIIQAITQKKQQLAALELKLAPALLRHHVIEAVPSGLVNYVVEFTADLFELAQYPRVIRHIVFNILEKTVESLAASSNEAGPEEAANLLQQPITTTEKLSVFDFLFTDRLKEEFGAKILSLFVSIDPKAKTWSGSAVQLLANLTKKIHRAPGLLVFSGIQQKVESLIKEKFKSDQAFKWSAAKMVVAINNKILAFAQDQTKDGMAAAITGQLQQIVGVKEAAEQMTPTSTAPTSTDSVAPENHSSSRYSSSNQ